MSCFLGWFHVNHLRNKFLEVGSSSGYHWNIHDETYVSSRGEPKLTALNTSKEANKNWEVEVDFWVKYDLQHGRDCNFQFQDSMKWSWRKWSWRFLINIYIYTYHVFFEKAICSYIFTPSILLKIFLSFPPSFPHSFLDSNSASQVTRLRCSKCLAPVAGRIGKRFIALPLSSWGSSDMGYGSGTASWEKMGFYDMFFWSFLYVFYM